MTTQPRRPGRPAASSPTLSVAARRGVPRAEIAQLFDVPGTTVDGWRRAGCPRLDDGRFRPAAVLAWLRARDAARADAAGRAHELGKWDEMAKRALALGRLHELQAKRERHVARQFVADEWARRCVAFRAAGLALVAELGAACANQPADVVERRANAIVRALLLRFAAMPEQPPTAGHAAAAPGAPPPAPAAAAPARRRRAAAVQTDPDTP